MKAEDSISEFENQYVGYMKILQVLCPTDS
jgi:hypothetical protein